jgi:hypothetical protein
MISKNQKKVKCFEKRTNKKAPEVDLSEFEISR